MTLKQFKKAIVLGSGLPFVRIREKFPTHFTPAIFNAAIRNLAYNTQCEGSRDYYAFQLLTHSVDWERLIPQVFDHFRRQDDPDEFDNLDQLFRLAFRFHKTGLPEASSVIFDRFDFFSHPDRAEMFGSRIMIQLGLPGLERYARATGRLIRLDKIHPDDEKYLKRDIKKYAPKRYKKHLRQLARKDMEIAIYLEKVIDDKSSVFWEHTPRKVSTYDKLKKSIAQGSYTLIKANQVKLLTEGQILEFAHDLVQETDPDKHCHHLRIFAHTTFPLDVRHLYQLLKSDNELTHIALARALGRIKAPEVRRLAIARLRQGRETEDAINMLGVNFQQEDETLLTRALKNAADEYELHRLGKASNYFSTLLPGTTFFDFSLAFIKRSRCAICRSEKLEYLLEHGQLSEDMRSALWYDSYQATRALAVIPLIR